MSYSFHVVKIAAEEDTLQQYGLAKIALTGSDVGRGVKRLFTWHDQGVPGEGVKGGLKWLGRNVREMGRDYVFGSPVTLAEQLQSAARRHDSIPKGVASYAKNWYWQKPTDWKDAVFQGAAVIPDAYDIYTAASTEDPSARRGALAGAAAGLALAPFTSRLGLAGAYLHAQGRDAAKRLVHQEAPPSPTLGEYTSPAGAADIAQNVMRSSRLEDFGAAP